MSAADIAGLQCDVIAGYDLAQSALIDTERMRCVHRQQCSKASGLALVKHQQYECAVLMDLLTIRWPRYLAALESCAP